MKVEQPEREYFFPKANPPITIKAKSRKEAEAKVSKTLTDIKDIKDK